MGIEGANHDFSMQVARASKPATPSNWVNPSDHAQERIKTYCNFVKSLRIADPCADFIRREHKKHIRGLTPISRPVFNYLSCKALMIW